MTREPSSLPRAIPTPFDRHLARRLRALDDPELAVCVAAIVDVDPRIEALLEALISLAEAGVIADGRGRAAPDLVLIEGGRR